MLPALLTTCLFALAAICATQATRVVSPSLANLLRLLIALAILKLWTLGAVDWSTEGVRSRFMLAGAIGFGAGGFCMFQAFPRIGSTLSLLVVECAAAISAAAFSWALLGAALNGAQILFAFLSISGVCWGLAPFKLPEVSKRTLLLGAGFATLASLAQGYSFTLSKQAFLLLGSEGLNGDPMVAASHRLTGGAGVALIAFCLATFVFKFKQKPENPLKGWKPKLWIPANALAGPVLGVSCMLWAIREVGNPGLVQAVVACATLLTVPLARKLERRTLKANYYFGACLSLIGTAGLLIVPT